MPGRLLEGVRPWVRSVKFGRLLRRAERDAQRPCPLDDARLDPAPGFIVGCGRSGTTITGQLLALHEGVHYLREPYHMWRTVLPATDMIQLFGEVPGGSHCLLGQEDATDDVARRLRRCFWAESRRGGGLPIVEKTPINAMRLGFLDTIAPGCRVLHLVRNGIDVVRSVERLARNNTYRISGRGAFNQWWGREDCKWTSLAADATAAGWFADDVPAIDGHFARGALEWLVSLEEVSASQGRLGERLLEVTYDDLTEDPAATLHAIAAHLRMEAGDDWIAAGTAMLDGARRNVGEPLQLPPTMAEAFNRWQAHYGFEGSASGME